MKPRIILPPLSAQHRSAQGERVRFRVISDGSGDPEQWIREVVATNLEAIEARIGTRILRSDGVIARPLGCGAFGCVFGLRDGRVLKVTHDSCEGAYSLWIKNLQEKGVRTKASPVLAVTARVDQVFRFPRRKRIEGSVQSVYGIVRERVGPAGEGLPPKLRKAVNLYTDGWDTFGSADPVDSDGTRFLGVAVARLGLDAIRSAGIEGARLYEFLAYAWSRRVPLMDVHNHNLARRLVSGPGGANAGQIVLFDYGGSMTCPISGELKPARPAPVNLRTFHSEVPPL